MEEYLLIFIKTNKILLKYKTVITQASHVLTDRTTDWAWTGLTSPIGREGVQFC